MKTKNSLISVVIPAFNNPEYTEKTLTSVLLQTYRPIEVILSDDHSPRCLKELVDKIQKDCNHGVTIKYFWQEENLNYYWNLQFVIDQATGKYIVLLDHDDWMIDNHHFSNAVLVMESQDNCHVSIANTFIEELPQTILQLSFQNWHYIDGKKLIKNQLFSTIHPARSAVLMRLDKLKDLQYKKYFIKKSVGHAIGVMPDEAFVLICLLASSGTVALSGRVVSVRGTPNGSLSSTSLWQTNEGQKLFIPHFLLYKYFYKTNCREGAQAMAHNLILRHPCHSFNWKIVSYLDYDKVAIFFMFSGLMLAYLIRLIKLPINAVKFIRKSVIWLTKRLLT